MQGFFNDLAIMAPAVVFNIYFAAASIPIGFVLAVFLALGKASPNPLINRLSRGYIYAFRGSPLFIQFFMFYSLALSLNLPLWKPWGVSGFVLHPLFIGPLVLILNTAAYTGEIFYGALRAVPRGEVEAARAYGMSGSQQFRRVVWPN
ncbi:MAG: ABC transporter permease subunit, partial [Proteobacteria bacterium]